MIQTKLNQAEVDNLFRRHAIFIETTNCVPSDVAAELFGAEAVDFVRKLSRGGEYVKPQFLDGEYFEFLTQDGFHHAATRRNLRLLRGNSDSSPAPAEISVDDPASKALEDLLARSVTLCGCAADDGEPAVTGVEA